MSFHPSPYSTANRNEGDPWSSLISAGSDIASLAIQTRGAVVLGKAQMTHDETMVEKNAVLLAAQEQVEQARGVSSRAAAALQGSVTTRTFLIAGGAVLVVAILGATVVAVKRSGSADDYEEYEE